MLRTALSFKLGICHGTEAGFQIVQKVAPSKAIRRHPAAGGPYGWVQLTRKC
jgi:hypothetical protein